MTDREIIVALAELCGFEKEPIPDCTDLYRWRRKDWVGGNWVPDSLLPNFVGDLNAIRVAEELVAVSSKPWSSKPGDHEDMRYISFLAEITGVKTREELVVSCNPEDRELLNKRAKPWPSPIVMPVSAIILSHHIPCTGYELCLIRATARQRAEAVLKALGKWRE